MKTLTVNNFIEMFNNSNTRENAIRFFQNLSHSMLYDKEDERFYEELVCERPDIVDYLEMFC